MLDEEVLAARREELDKLLIRLAARYGLHPWPPERAPRRKRKPRGSSPRTLAILAAYQPGMSLAQLAQQFGVSRQRVSQIMKNMRNPSN